MTKEQLARAWDEAAEGYDAYFVPRFAPWVELAVRALSPEPDLGAAIADGPILVPCCGTFPELELLAGAFADRELVGIDLSAGMIRIARERAARWPRASAVERDASTLDPRWTAGCGAVVSVFGLQQLPEPEQALRSWLGALRPGGVLSVVYWPSITEEDGPFALLRELLPGRKEPDDPWEDRLLTALGATVERYELPTYPMTHPDATTFFTAYSDSGPLRATANARGEAFIADLRKKFVEQAPAGEWTHHPRARLIVARAPAR